MQLAEEPQRVSVPNADELVAHPTHLKDIRQLYKTDRPTLGDVLCNQVSEAMRKWFSGDGKTPYTPQSPAKS